MPRKPNIVEQVQERQRTMFRIAMDPSRYGLTFKVIQMDSTLGADSLRNYISGETVMPLTALIQLVEVIPDELLSLLLPECRHIVQAPEEIDHDEFAAAAEDYFSAKMDAHKEDSPSGPAVSDCEREKLDAKVIQLRGRG